MYCAHGMFEPLPLQYVDVCLMRCACIVLCCKTVSGDDVAGDDVAAHAPRGTLSLQAGDDVAAHAPRGTLSLGAT